MKNKKDSWKNLDCHMLMTGNGLFMETKDGYRLPILNGEGTPGQTLEDILDWNNVYPDYRFEERDVWIMQQDGRYHLVHAKFLDDGRVQFSRSNWLDDLDK